MRIAVTGGAGFLGAAAASAARSAGHEVVIFDRALGHDVTGPLDLLDGADAVIHLAGLLGTSELFDSAAAAINVNVIGTLRVLQWCERNTAQYVGITMPYVFQSVYTATRVCSDRLAEAWRLFRGVRTSHVRAYNAYGPGQKYGTGHPQKYVPTFATLAWQGKPLPVWGDGNQTVDAVHSEDVGRMLLDATQFGDGQVFDAGTGVALTVNEVAEFVLRVTGSKAGIEHLPMRDGEVPHEVVAGGEGWDLLDWRPRHDWDRLAETIHWYRRHADVES